MFEQMLSGNWKAQHCTKAEELQTLRSLWLGCPEWQMCQKTLMGKSPQAIQAHTQHAHCQMTREGPKMSRVLPAGVGIHARGWLVQEDDGWIRQEGYCHAELALLPTAQLLSPCFHFAFQACRARKIKTHKELLAVPGGRFHSDWPSRGLLSGTPDPNRLACLAVEQDAQALTLCSDAQGIRSDASVVLAC